MGPNSQFPADLVTFTEEILNGKLHFLCSDKYDLDYLQYYWTTGQVLPDYEFCCFWFLLISREILDNKFASIDFPANIYFFKVNDRNTRKRCKICSKLNIKTPERRWWNHSSVFIASFGHNSHLFLVFLLLTLNK